MSHVVFKVQLIADEIKKPEPRLIINCCRGLAVDAVHRYGMAGV